MGGLLIGKTIEVVEDVGDVDGEVEVGVGQCAVCSGEGGCCKDDATGVGVDMWYLWFIVSCDLGVLLFVA